MNARYEICFTDGWYPIDLTWAGTKPLVKFAKIDKVRFSSPFFLEEFQGAEHKLTVPLDELEIDCEAHPLRPVYFVYHTGRCGSTLAARMLNELPGLRVFSEPLALNLIVEPPNDIAPCELRDRFRKVAILMDLATPEHFHGLVVKWASWALFSDKLLRSVMQPRATAFLWRDPVETLVSLLGNPPIWVNEPAFEVFFRRHAPDFRPANVGVDAETASRLLGALLAAVTRLPDPVLALDYPSLPDSIIDVLCPHMGFALDKETEGRMREVARFDAKSSKPVEFVSDSEAKRNRARADILYFAERHAYPELENMKQALRARQ